MQSLFSSVRYSLSHLISYVDYEEERSTDWWGYEISLPPPILVKLATVHSVQQTFFGFMQAFLLAGGKSSLSLFPLAASIIELK